MPRKQNGFGNPKSLGFKGAGRVDKGKGVGAPGTYPSNRRYGTSVHRTVIEKYNLDSDWVKWRKGFEYYNQAAWYELETYNPETQEYEKATIETKLYQGTDYEVDVVFDGYKFATKNADSNNHYVMRRTTTSSPDIGVITAVQNDDLLYPEQKKYKEIWCQGAPGADARLLTRMIGERLTDGETEATLNYLLTDELLPALYIGKSYENPTVVKVRVPLINLIAEPGVEINNNYQELVGKICYIPDFYKEKALADVTETTWTDSDYYWTVDVNDDIAVTSMSILDPEVDDLPPSLYDISSLPTLFTADTGTLNLKGTYLYKKDIYQRFYGRQYLTADLVKEQIDQCSYTVMPFTIVGVEQTDDELIFTSVPFNSEFRMTAALSGAATLVFADWSFTKTSIDEYDGRYYHNPGAPGSAPWMRINTDIDPWMDEVFTSGNPLQPATVYTCSCPNHSHAMLRAPQATTDENRRKQNRQSRYPMPTVMGKNDFDALALNSVAGLIESWETREHKMSFKMCKHSIAAMFINHIKIQEPNKYPTVDAREKFEEKLRKEIEEVAEEFALSYERGGITALEIIFALAQGLNLDDVELAYVMLNSNF